ncbi:hypothetical protein ACA910_002282 [Epithemia clementina (nom. ined.)]
MTTTSTSPTTASGEDLYARRNASDYNRSRTPTKSSLKQISTSRNGTTPRPTSPRQSTQQQQQKTQRPLPPKEFLPSPPARSRSSRRQQQQRQDEPEYDQQIQPQRSLPSRENLPSSPVRGRSTSRHQQRQEEDQYEQRLLPPKENLLSPPARGRSSSRQQHQRQEEPEYDYYDQQPQPQRLLSPKENTFSSPARSRSSRRQQQGQEEPKYDQELQPQRALPPKESLPSSPARSRSSRRQQQLQEEPEYDQSPKESLPSSPARGRSSSRQQQQRQEEPEYDQEPQPQRLLPPKEYLPSSPARSRFSRRQQQRQEEREYDQEPQPQRLLPPKEDLFSSPARSLFRRQQPQRQEELEDQESHLEPQPQDEPEESPPEKPEEEDMVSRKEDGSGLSIFMPRASIFSNKHSSRRASGSTTRSASSKKSAPSRASASSKKSQRSQKRQQQRSNTEDNRPSPNATPISNAEELLPSLVLTTEKTKMTTTKRDKDERLVKSGGILSAIGGRKKKGKSSAQSTAELLPNDQRSSPKLASLDINQEFPEKHYHQHPILLEESESRDEDVDMGTIRSGGSSKKILSGGSHKSIKSGQDGASSKNNKKSNRWNSSSSSSSFAKRRQSTLKANDLPPDVAIVRSDDDGIIFGDLASPASFPHIAAVGSAFTKVVKTRTPSPPPMIQRAEVPNNEEAEDEEEEIEPDEAAVEEQIERQPKQWYRNRSHRALEVVGGQEEMISRTRGKTRILERQRSRRQGRDPASSSTRPRSVRSSGRKQPLYNMDAKRRSITEETPARCYPFLATADSTDNHSMRARNALFDDDEEEEEDDTKVDTDADTNNDSLDDATDEDEAGDEDSSSFLQGASETDHPIVSDGYYINRLILGMGEFVNRTMDFHQCSGGAVDQDEKPTPRLSAVRLKRKKPRPATNSDQYSTGNTANISAPIGILDWDNDFVPTY